MIYITSDLHGYSFDKFKALLEKAGYSDNDFLFILGDVIDRGPDGVAILKWLMLQPNAELILGNHEAMLLSCAFLFEEITEETLNSLDSKSMHFLLTWQSNGAEPTIRALAAEAPETRADILDYLRDAPLYDMVSVGNQDYVLVHAGLGNFEEEKPLDAYSPNELYWHRPKLNDTYSKKFITLLGHTPTAYYGEEYNGHMLMTDTWWNLDTGAAGGGTPMLLRLDDKKAFYIE